MKTERIGRAGALALGVAGLLAASWILPPAVHRARRLCPARPDGVAEAGAYAAFARRYGVSCSMCHNSFPQLNDVGYRFRTSGYRMPDELGSDAKWSNWGDNTSVKFFENYTWNSTKGNTAMTAETNGFSNSGFQFFPIEGAFGKYVAMNSEVDVNAGNTSTTKGTAGSVSMSNFNAAAAFPINADSWLTTRVGLMSAFQGYGAADRFVGALSPTFKPTPSQIQPGGTASYTYPGFAPSGEGVELAYNWKDTHLSAQITNGYNSFNNSGNQGEDNHYKDYSFFINQMLPLNASSLAAHFYTGTSGYSQNAATAVNGVGGAEAAATPFAASWYDHYWRGILYATVKLLPKDQLDVLAGWCQGMDHTFDRRTNVASPSFHSTGWFATLQSVQELMNQQFTGALSYGTNRASTATAGNRVSDVTLSLAIPIENNKFDISGQTRRTQAFGSKDVTANVGQVQWEFMF